MRGILGITITTFRHGVRSRVLLFGILAYVIAMALAVAITPRPVVTGMESSQSADGTTFDAERAALSPEGYRMRSIQATSVNLAIFFGFAITALVAATWLPAQIRGGELTFVLSKPIGRVTAIFGTLLGFGLLFLILFAIYALCGTGALRLAAATSGDSAESARQLETIRANAAANFGAKGGTAAGNHVELTSTAQKAVWEFKGLAFSGRALEGGMAHCRFVGEIVKADNEFVNHTDLLVSVVDPATGNAIAKERINNVKSGQTVEFTFSAEQLPKSDFEIAVSPAVDGYRVFCYRRGLGVITGISGFEWNYIKTFGLAFMGLAVFIALAVAGSTFLSANVSILFSVGMGSAGACMGFFKEYLQTIYGEVFGSTTLVGIEGRHVFFTHVPGGADALGQSISAIVTQTAVQIFNRIIFGLVPDWSKFNGVDYVLDKASIPASVFGRMLLYAGIYCAACIVVAAFAFGRRELK
jgi:hypothetical protein